MLNDVEHSATWRNGQRVVEGGRLGGLETAKATLGDRSAGRARAAEMWSKNPNLSTSEVARRLILKGVTKRGHSTVRNYIADLQPRKESC